MNRKEFIKLLGLSPLLYSMKDLNQFYNWSQSFSWTEKMPVLFLGHGSPMNAIEENEFVQGFRNVATSIPKPQAILCISAHWYTKGTKVTAMEVPPTIHDFGGFPQALFDVQYPAKGSPILAKTTQQLLQPTAVSLDLEWGLDHGAWSVIKHLYPNADVPVIQMSIDYSLSNIQHWEIAKKLTELRNKGILIIGSGNLIHNLQLADFRNINKQYGYDWAIEAHDIMNTYLKNGNYTPLIEYKKQSKAIQLAVPTPDHFIPLIYALGLQEKNESLQLFNDAMLAGSLSMTSIKIS